RPNARRLCREPGEAWGGRTRDPDVAAERGDSPRPLTVPGAAGLVDALSVFPGRRPAGGPRAGPPSDLAPADQDQTRPPALSAGAAHDMARGVPVGCSTPECSAGRPGPQPGARREARGSREPTAAPTRPYKARPLAYLLC